MGVLVGMGAVALDTGRLYVVRTQLQNAADAAAMGAAAELGASAGQGNYSDVYLAAERYAALNVADGRSPGPESVETTLGQGILDASEGRYTLTPDANPPNAVRVVLRLEGEQGVRTLLAPVFGSSDLNRRPVAAMATAMLIPRDIALVADLSASHNDDSELKRYRNTEINLEDVWRNLPVPRGNNGVGNGFDPPPPGHPNENDGPGTGPGHSRNRGGNSDPGADPANPHDGPFWGYTNDLGWGETVLDTSYDPASDPGLVNLPKNQDWSNAWVVDRLTTDHYSQAEINVIMSAAHDNNSNYGGDWPNRVAVAMGFAFWRSGMTDAQGNPDGRWAVYDQDPGDGDDRVETSELYWRSFPGGISDDDQSQNWRKNRWHHYIRSYMDQNNGMTRANSAFLYKFGVKTIVNYLLEKRPLSSQSPDLRLVPTQPMQAVKDAVRVMTEVVADLGGDDQLSLESYDRWGAHRENLTYDYELVADHLDEMQAGQDGYYTNMGDGIQHAIAELTGPRARDTAVKIMVLLTDGRANVNESGGYTDYPGGRQWALDSTDQAVVQGIRIYCVSVGSAADRNLMQEIARRGGGTEFYAAGTIDAYAAELRQIFETLGGARPVIMIE
jgi:hypothetical protein